MERKREIERERLGLYNKKNSQFLTPFSQLATGGKIAYITAVKLDYLFLSPLILFPFKRPFCFIIHFLLTYTTREWEEA